MTHSDLIVIPWIYIYIFDLADAFIQSDFQVHSTMRVKTQNNKNRESTISSKTKLQSAISKCHLSATKLFLYCHHKIKLLFCLQ